MTTTPPAPAVREAIYDERIAPLMTEVIAICREAGIPIYASFSLDGDLACTTYVAERERIPEDEREAFDEWQERFGGLAKQIRQDPSALIITLLNGERI